MAEPKPVVVIVSSSSTKPKSLMKLITRKTDSEDEPHKVSQSWEIDTKYYTAQINIHGISEHYVRTSEYNESVEALIILMDSNKQTGLADLKKWELIENDCDPEIKLLISNYFTNDTKITKAKATEWCLKHSFELIELYPNVHQNPEGFEEDEIIKEKLGVERIIEALQTHVWPNLDMKEPLESKGKERSEAASDHKFDLKQSSTNKQLGDANLLDDFLTNEGTDDFTELFTQLHMMKESIQSMPTRERKHCAEQMVTAFWRAIGGDEEEIDDL